MLAVDCEGLLRSSVSAKTSTYCILIASECKKKNHQGILVGGPHPFVKHDNLKSGTFNTLRGVFCGKVCSSSSSSMRGRSRLHPAQLINSPDET